MAGNIQTPEPAPSASHRARLLRIIAVAVLLLGIGGADLVYWHGTRSADGSADPAMLGYDKSQARQAGTLYGQQGVVVQEWVDSLRKPSTQAIIIGLAAALVAGGCFYFAHLLEGGGQQRYED